MKLQLPSQSASFSTFDAKNDDHFTKTSSGLTYYRENSKRACLLVVHRALVEDGAHAPSLLGCDFLCGLAGAENGIFF